MADDVVIRTTAVLMTPLLREWIGSENLLVLPYAFRITNQSGFRRAVRAPLTPFIFPLNIPAGGSFFPFPWLPPTTALAGYPRAPV